MLRSIAYTAVITVGALITTEGAVQIDGDMEVRWPLSGSSAYKVNFSCLVATNGWKIITHKDGNVASLGHREMAADGTNFFLVEYLDNLPSTNPVVRAHGTVTAYSGSIPVSHQDFSHVVWLAYCRAASPSNEFDGATITSRLVYDMAPERLTCVARWNENRVHALEELKVFNPGVTFGSSGKKYRLNAPFAEGYCTAIFSASDFVLIAEEVWPESASWTVFMPRSKAVSVDDLDVTASVTLKTKAIKAVNEPVELKPHLTMLTSVVDYRFESLSKVSGAAYYTTNGWWAPGEQRFDSAAALKAESNKTPPRRIIALCGFVIFSLLTLWIAIKSYNSSRHR